MQVKVFEAADMASGLKMVRKALGPDALILSTRTVKNGKLGLLGKQHLEITAAIDNQVDYSHNNNGITPMNKSFYDKYAENQLSKDSSPPPVFEEKNEAALNDILTATKNTGNPDINAPDDNLREEFNELKNLVKNLAGELTRINTPGAVENSQASNPLHSLEQKLFSTRSNAKIEDILLEQGINQETARIISTFVNEQLTDADVESPDILKPFLHNVIADIMSVKTPDFENYTTQKKIALIGPTGVGKTTTLAKIAARYLSTVSNSVALITIDTYRIAAVEQLKVYGEIMKLPVEVVITPDQLSQAINKHSDKELILIDTAGRSHLDSLSIEELQSFLTPDLDIENHLVLSSTTRDLELLQNINTFSTLGVDRTIFTKIDECSNLGVLLNIQVKNGTPISFVTNGQRVPEDLLELDNKYLAQLIVPFSNGIIHDQ